MAYDWEYTGCRGPEYWCTIAPAACGYRQSPIDINTFETEHKETLRFRPLEIIFNPYAPQTVTNNGCSVQVDVVGNSSTLRGGPLKEDVYILRQFHFHWGSSDCKGSEHKVNGAVYSGELHLVYWNASRFASFDEALPFDQGICVLAVFIASGYDNIELDKLCRLMDWVEFCGECTPVADGLNPAYLLPGDREYWTYKGSLTTPPCYESVRFIIFRQPIQVSQRQLDQFRRLKTGPRGSEHRHLVDNFRPTQPLNGRKVVASFVDDFY